MPAQLHRTFGERSDWAAYAWGAPAWVDERCDERWTLCNNTVARMRVSDLVLLGRWTVAAAADAIAFAEWLGAESPVLVLLVRGEDGALRLQRWTFTEAESDARALLDFASEAELDDIVCSAQSGHFLVLQARSARVIDAVRGALRGTIPYPASESAALRPLVDDECVRFVTTTTIERYTHDGAPDARVLLSEPIGFETVAQIDDELALLTLEAFDAPPTQRLLNLRTGAITPLCQGRWTRHWVVDRELYACVLRGPCEVYSLETGARVRAIARGPNPPYALARREGSLYEFSASGWVRSDLRTLEPIDERRAFGAVRSIVVQRDGARIAVSDGETLRVLDAETGAPVIEHKSSGHDQLVRWLDSGAILLERTVAGRARFVELVIDADGVHEHSEPLEWAPNAMTRGAQATSDGRARLCSATVSGREQRRALVRRPDGSWGEHDVWRAGTSPYDVALLPSDDEQSDVIATVDCVRDGRWLRLSLTGDEVRERVITGDRRIDSASFSKEAALCVERLAGGGARWFVARRDGTTLDLPLEAHAPIAYFSGDGAVFATLRAERNTVYVLDVEATLRATITLPEDSEASAIALDHEGRRLFVGTNHGQVLEYGIERP
ncbi:MAG: hypothetical protein U0269_35935 [Polyangiales bacterium]